MTSSALKRYLELVDELLWRRAFGPLSDDEEEHYAQSLNDLRAGMARGEEDRLTALITERKNADRTDSGFGVLVDNEAEAFPLRKAG